MAYNEKKHVLQHNAIICETGLFYSISYFFTRKRVGAIPALCAKMRTEMAINSIS